MRVIDLEAGRQIVGERHAAELRLRLGDFQHHHQARVLLDLAGIDRIAGERVGLALDLEALFGGGLRRRRRAGDGDHRLDLILAGIGDTQRLFQIAGLDGAVERALQRRAADIERHPAAVLGERARREQKPGILLRRRRAQRRARRVDALHRGLHGGARRAAFARERHQSGGVPQGRAVVFTARRVGLCGRRQRFERRRIDALGAGAVARHGERRGDLRLRDRRRQRIELGVGDVAKIADRSRAVARQHIERIGDIDAAVLARVGGVGDGVAQPVEREPEGRLRHRDLAFARAGEEVGHVGIEPDVVAADAPQAERAVGILPRQQRLDRLAQLLLRGRIGRDGANPWQDR